MNGSDEISQAERRRIMIEERRLKTYHGHAMSAIDDERGGRYATDESKQTVIGANPIAYPSQPAGSPWHSDPCGTEPPLGYDINAQDAVGEPHEIKASEEQAASSPEGAAAEPSPVISRQGDGGDGSTSDGTSESRPVFPRRW